MTQATLFKQRETKSGADLAMLISIMFDCAVWKTAKDIRVITGWNDRYIRELAESSNGEIISGQKGYLLTSHATKAEMHHATNWLVSQARKMFRRAARIERRWHG